MYLENYHYYSNNDSNGVEVKLVVHTYAMKTHGWAKIELHSFLSSTPDGDELSASRLGRITPGERADVLKKMCCPCRESKHDFSVVNSVSLITPPITRSPALELFVYKLRNLYVCNKREILSEFF